MSYQFINLLGFIHLLGFDVFNISYQLIHLLYIFSYNVIGIPFHNKESNLFIYFLFKVG